MHLCAKCGKTQLLEVTLEDTGHPANKEHPRECKHCGELSSYLMTLLGNYHVNVYGILNRIRSLENRVVELEKELKERENGCT